MCKSIFFFVMLLFTSIVSAKDADILRFSSKFQLKEMRTLTDSAISKDGKKLVVGTRDGRVIVWDTDSEEVIFERKYPRNVVKSLAFANDNPLVAISLNKSAQMVAPFEAKGEGSNQAFHIIDYTNGNTYGSNIANARKIVFFPQDDMIAVVGPQGEAAVYFTDDLSLMDVFSHETNSGCATSYVGVGSDNATLAIADNCETTVIYNIWQNHTPLMIFNLRRYAEDGRVTISAMETSGDLVAIARSNINNPVNSHFVDVYDMVTGEKRGELHPHKSNVYGLDIIQLTKSDKKFMMITGSRDRTVKITNPFAKDIYTNIEGDTQIKRVGIAADKLYYADIKGNINVFERHTLSCNSSTLLKLVNSRNLDALVELEKNCSNLNYNVRDQKGRSLVRIAYDRGYIKLANQLKSSKYNIKWDEKASSESVFYTTSAFLNEEISFNDRIKTFIKLKDFGFKVNNTELIEVARGQSDSNLFGYLINTITLKNPMKYFGDVLEKNNFTLLKLFRQNQCLSSRNSKEFNCYFSDEHFDMIMERHLYEKENYLEYIIKNFSTDFDGQFFVKFILPNKELMNLWYDNFCTLKNGRRNCYYMPGVSDMWKSGEHYDVINFFLDKKIIIETSKMSTSELGRLLDNHLSTNGNQESYELLLRIIKEVNEKSEGGLVWRRDSIYSQPIRRFGSRFFGFSDSSDNNDFVERGKLMLLLMSDIDYDFMKDYNTYSRPYNLDVNSVPVFQFYYNNGLYRNTVKIESNRHGRIIIRDAFPSNQKYNFETVLVIKEYKKSRFGKYKLIKEQTATSRGEFGVFIDKQKATKKMEVTFFVKHNGKRLKGFKGSTHIRNFR